MKHPGPLLWFRFHANDLPVFAWLSFRLHVAACSTCGARLRAEQAERASALAALDLARPAVRSRPRAWLAIPVLAAAAAVFFLFVRPPRVEPVERVEDGLRGMRDKGGTTFVIYVGKGDAGATLLGDTCRPGDALQAQFRSEKPYLMIVGVDPENHARTLVPLDGTTSTAIQPGVHDAPQSWVLDAAPGRERFVAFFSDAPLDATTAQAVALQDRPQREGAVVVTRECTKAVR